jgi:hypothetical protein
VRRNQANRSRSKVSGPSLKDGKRSRTQCVLYSVLRNVSNQAISVTPRLYWMQAGAAHSVRLPAFTLAPRNSFTIDLVSALQRAGLSSYSGTVNVALDVQGPRFALLADSGSVDQKNTYVFGVQPAAVLDSVAKSVSYWSTGNGDDTMVTLWNPADEAQDLIFTLFFAGGQYALPVHLEGKVTRSFNISEIILNQIPDPQGRTIPLSIHEGSATISGSQGESEHILVVMESGTYNVQKATCGGTYCRTCTGATEAFIDNDPWGVPVSDSIQETFTVQYNTGKQYNYTSSSSWSSGNTSIVTVSSGTVVAHAVGGTNIAASEDSTPDYSSGCYSYIIECPLNEGEDGQAPGNVTPQITSLTPGTFGVGRAGATLSIGGNGFGSAPSVSIVDSAGNPISAAVQSGASNTAISVTINTTGAALGQAQVTVTNNGEKSAPSGFSIICAVPTGFTQASSNCAGSTGVLSFTYTWASPTGNQADLATCTVAEVVSYPNNGQPPLLLSQTPPFLTRRSSPEVRQVLWQRIVRSRPAEALLSLTVRQHIRRRRLISTHVVVPTTAWPLRLFRGLAASPSLDRLLIRPAPGCIKLRNQESHAASIFLNEHSPPMLRRLSGHPGLFTWPSSSEGDSLPCRGR